MEVHKPKLVQNWRELVKEWGIIVLGVLTALLAEQAVQSIEWHHKVDAAIADMKNELSNGDGTQAYVRMAMHDCVESRLNAIRSAAEAGDRPRSRRLIDSVWLPNNTYDSLARESATASDVASHMPTATMMQFRIAYDVVPQLDRLADRELTDLARLRALPSTGGVLEASEKLAAINAVEALRMDNDTMNRDGDFVLMRLGLMNLGLQQPRLGHLLNEARAHYPGCLTNPHRRFVSHS
jgi:hypothetical protein